MAARLGSLAGSQGLIRRRGAWLCAAEVHDCGWHALESCGLLWVVVDENRSEGIGILRNQSSELHSSVPATAHAKSRDESPNPAAERIEIR